MFPVHNYTFRHFTFFTLRMGTTPNLLQANKQKHNFAIRQNTKAIGVEAVRSKFIYYK